MARSKRVGENDATRTGTVLTAIDRVLEPLSRLLLDHGIGLPIMVERLKSAYVRVADAQFGERAGGLSDSRVSVLTGVHRKDVRRLRRAHPSDGRPPRTVSAGGQIIVKWTGKPEYLDARKRPLPLPRLRRDGHARSFEALAESVSKDVGPRAILDELVRLGVVSIDADDRVRLNRGAFVPQEGFQEKAYYLAKNIHDHLAAAAHNLRGDSPPHLERSVHYVQLSEASVERLRQLAERTGMRSLNEMNRAAQALKAHDSRGRRGDQRMTFGVYFYGVGDEAAAHARKARTRTR
jgi:uncharacterized protein DUF6502